MKDRKVVQGYLDQYISSCAYFGYEETHNNIEKLTQVFRRLYKEPEQVDPMILLDYLVVLAVSGKYYQDFDEKSKQFIEDSISLVETRFTGSL